VLSLRKISMLLLAILFLLTLSACARGTRQAAETNPSANTPKAEAQLQIKATNYAFNEQVYHLKVGVPVEITLDNEDGNHGVKIPEWNVQLDRSHPSAVVTPDKTGQFELSCSIPCGPGHHNMKATIIVE
jgi:cytochrome c oxidase subunit II